MLSVAKAITQPETGVNRPISADKRMEHTFCVRVCVTRGKPGRKFANMLALIVVSGGISRDFPSLPLPSSFTFVTFQIFHNDYGYNSIQEGRFSFSRREDRKTPGRNVLWSLSFDVK